MTSKDSPEGGRDKAEGVIEEVMEAEDRKNQQQQHIKSSSMYKFINLQHVVHLGIPSNLM